MDNKKKSSSSSKKKSSDSKKLTLVAAVAGAVAVIAIGVTAAILLTGGQAGQGAETASVSTSVSSVEAESEALQAGISEETLAKLQDEFEKTYGGSTYEVSIGDRKFMVPVNLVPDMQKLQEDFEANGEEGLSLSPLFEDNGEIRAAVEEFAETYNTTPVEAVVEFSEEEGILSVTKATNGQGINVDDTVQKILEAIEKGDYSGTVTVEPETLEAAPLDLNKVAESVYIYAQDATFDYTDGQINIIPEQPGREIMIAELEEALNAAAEGETVQVPTYPIEPALTAEELDAKLFADLITSYRVVDGGSYSQINNQSLACNAINGTVVLPGEIFSFNDVVGDTTAAKGYVEDYAYQNGKLVKEVGGGVCRVASTLYASVLYSTLEVVMRYNHSSPVHYLPLGMDATVSYPLPNMQFRNNRDYPIRVNMWVADGYVQAYIYGTAQEDDPVVDVYLENHSSMSVSTYRVFYNGAGEEIGREFMHTSNYKTLATDTPTPTPTPSPTPTETPTPTPTETEAAPTEAAPTEAAPTEAAPTETAPTEAAPTEAAPTEAAPTEAAPTEAAPTEAAPTEAAPTEAAPTEAAPTEAAPTEVAPTETAPEG